MSKYEIDCDIIEDVLPLYVENLSSESTKKMIEQHVRTCEKCAQLLNEMEKKVSIPADTDTTMFIKIRKKMYQKNVFYMGIAIAIMSLLMFLTLGNLFEPVHVPFEALEDVKVIADEDENLRFEATTFGNALSVETIVEGDATFASISVTETRWDRLFGTKQKLISNIEKTNNPIQAVYYYPGNSNGDVLLYSNINFSGGMVSLERLTQNYYLTIAIILFIISSVICLFLKNKRKKYKACKFILIPLSYIVAHILIFAGKKNIYTLNGYVFKILLITVLAYMIMLWTFAYVVKRKINQGDNNDKDYI